MYLHVKRISSFFRVKKTSSTNLNFAKETLVYTRTIQVATHDMKSVSMMKRNELQKCDPLNVYNNVPLINN